MMSDEEVQKYARKSAILIAKMKDGTYKVLFFRKDTGISGDKTIDKYTFTMILNKNTPLD